MNGVLQYIIVYICIGLIFSFVSMWSNREKVINYWDIWDAFEFMFVSAFLWPIYVMVVLTDQLLKVCDIINSKINKLKNRD